jgi:hypothetical protein
MWRSVNKESFCLILSSFNNNVFTGYPNVLLVTVSARSKAYTVFARWNTGVAGSNPILGINTCMYSVYLCCPVRPYDGPVLYPRSSVDLLHGLGPRANYTDRATAASRRSDCQLFADRGCHVVTVTNPYVRILVFLDRNLYFSIK